MKFQVQILKIKASHVSQLNMLEMLPCSFDWVEVWGVGRQMLDAYPTANGTCQELLQCRGQ